MIRLAEPEFFQTVAFGVLVVALGLGVRHKHIGQHREMATVKGG